MFFGCKSLTSLNLSNFDTSSVLDMHNMFSELLLTSLYLSNFLVSKVTNMEYMFYRSPNLIFVNLSSAIENSNIKLFRFLEGTQNNIVFCFDESKNPKLTEALNELGCAIRDCSPEWTKNQKKIFAENGTCVENLENNCPNNNFEYENKCYSKCPIGTIENGEKCINITDNYNDDLYLKSSEINYYTNDIIKDEYVANIITDNYIKNNDNHIDNDSHFNNLTYLFYNDLNDILLYMNNLDKLNLNIFIINNIMKGTLSNLINNLIDKNESYIIKKKNEIFQISTLSSQINTVNLTIINFNKCFDILKRQYNLKENEILILFKIEHIIPEFNIPLIEYAIFSEDGKIRFNLDFCKNISIFYQIPIILNENELFKYDPNNEYYKDNCHPKAYENKLDLTIYERKDDFNNKRVLCQKNCTYKNYNNTIKRVECECKINNHINLFWNITIDKKKLLNTFINAKKLMNIDVIKCKHLLFIKKGLISNIGNYILLGNIFSSSLIMFIYICNGYSSFIEEVKNIKNVKKNNKKGNLFDMNRENVNNKKKNTIREKNNNPLKKTKKSNGNSFKKNIKKNNNKNNKKTNLKTDKKETTQQFEQQIQFKKNDYELNTLSYEEAIIKDQRTYSLYYLSLIRTKQPIIVTFFTKNDYNSRLIKIILFISNFSIFCFVNALFFNDSTMHQIYEDEGQFNFIYQIPQIIYSTIISSVIKLIITKLSLTEDSIIEIKGEKNTELITYKFNKFKKKLIVKMFLFFIMNFLFLIAFWYYLSCFCAVYKNTQIHFVKDTLISFGISLLYPFIINLIPGMLRIPALKSKKEQRTCLYSLSKVIQII